MDGRRIGIVHEAAQLEAATIATTPRTIIVTAKNTASVTRPIFGQERITMPTITSISAGDHADPATAVRAEGADDPDHALGDQEDAATTTIASRLSPGRRRKTSPAISEMIPRIALSARRRLAEDRVQDLQDRRDQQVDPGEDAERQQREPGPHDGQDPGHQADHAEDDEQPPMLADLPTSPTIASSSRRVSGEARFARDDHASPMAGEARSLPPRGTL